MDHTKIFTMEELHRMDPSQLISHDGHRPMQVNEVIQHLCDGRWPAKPVQPEPDQASQQEPQA
jgi:hypothetical protein